MQFITCKSLSVSISSPAFLRIPSISILISPTFETAPKDFTASRVAFISSDNSILFIILFPSERAAQISALCAKLFDGGIVSSPESFDGFILISIKIPLFSLFLVI